MKLTIAQYITVFGMSIVLVFGFLAFILMDHSIYVLCPVSALGSGDCPPQGSAFELMNHHFSWWRDFVQALGGSAMNSLFVLHIIAAMLMFYVFGLIKAERIYGPHLNFLVKSLYAGLLVKARDRFLCWIARRHKKDPDILYWVHDFCPI